MEEMAIDSAFDVRVRHNIDGRAQLFKKALPLNVDINGSLTIPRYKFGDVVATS